MIMEVSGLTAAPGVPTFDAGLLYSSERNLPVFSADGPGS